MEFSQWLSGKGSACHAGDVVLIPGWRRSPGGGNGSSLQYSCLGNPIDRGAWWATVPGIAKVGPDRALIVNGYIPLLKSITHEYKEKYRHQWMSVN